MGIPSRTDGAWLRNIGAMGYVAQIKNCEIAVLAVLADSDNDFAVKKVPNSKRDRGRGNYRCGSFGGKDDRNVN